MSENFVVNEIIKNACSSSNFIFNIIENNTEKEEIFHFMQTEFRLNEPITRAIGSTEDDTFNFYQDLCSIGLKKPYSILARNKTDNRLAGICLNEFCNHFENPQNLKNDLNKKTDYSKEIQNGIYKNLNANRLITLIKAAETEPLKFIPDCKSALKIDVLSVHSDFMGSGLGSKLIEISMQIAKKLKCDYVLTCASAKASNHIFSKFGFKTLRKIHFADFLENGAKVYQNLHDSGDGISFMCLKL